MKSRTRAVSRRAAQVAAAFLIPCAALLAACGALSVGAWNRMPEQLLDDVSGSIWGVFDKCGHTRGTAFVVERGGAKHLVTSLHVIRGYRIDDPLDGQIRISRSESHGRLRPATTTTLRDVRVTFADDVLDIAVMTATGIEALPGLRLSREAGRRVQVFAVGLAQAKDYFGISITDGIVSNPDKEVVTGSRAFSQTHIEHTATLAGGQSGGPLVDMRGRVLGVNAFSYGGPTLHLFYATPLERVLDVMNTSGRLEIRNTGSARIKGIYVTPENLERAEIDKLPPEIGRVNGFAAIRFDVPAGRYRVELVTEEAEPTVWDSVRIEPGKTTDVEYANKDYGLRLANTGCNDILGVALLNPVAQAMLEQIEHSNWSDEQKAQKAEELIMSAEILRGNPLAPGQTWVEWIVEGDYDMYVFTFAPSVAEFRVPKARPVRVRDGELTRVYLAD
ncbi:MAG: serine protease [Proteobacteria bacterium]|jgi:hypothetical protein|nr:serine protease [Pseudomonadota bacterium]